MADLKRFLIDAPVWGSVYLGSLGSLGSLSSLYRLLHAIATCGRLEHSLRATYAFAQLGEFASEIKKKLIRAAQESNFPNYTVMITSPF